MLTQTQIQNMLDLQDTLNKRVHPRWLVQAFPWHRAIMVETVELLDHYGWKWWKAQPANIPQARLELVDIWHFILSMALNNNEGDYALAGKVIEGIFYTPEAETDATVPDLCDLMTGYAAEGKVCVPAFVLLMRELQMSWGELYQHYVGKNVLNHFRQDHGYAAGTYNKTWGGVEDNIVLTEIFAQNPEATPTELYRSLEDAYAG